MAQQLFGILQTGIADEGMWRLVGQLLHSAVQMHTAQSYLAGNHIHTQVLIIHVIIDYLHHLFHQLVFWRQVFFYCKLPVALALVASKLVFQSTAHVEQVDDGAAQNVHIEWLHHKGISARLQAGKLVFLSAHRCKQNHRNVVGVHIVLNLGTERVSVHLWHHDV